MQTSSANIAAMVDRHSHVPDKIWLCGIELSSNTIIYLVLVVLESLIETRGSTRVMTPTTGTFEDTDNRKVPVATAG